MGFAVGFAVVVDDSPVAGDQEYVTDSLVLDSCLTSSDQDSKVPVS